MFLHGSLRDILTLIGSITVFILYFIPTINAYRRHNEKAMYIFLLNLAFGWTVFAWIAAYVWSQWDKNAKQTFTSMFSSNK